jgi:amino acid adenylation domain-containing protein
VRAGSGRRTKVFEVPSTEIGQASAQGNPSIAPNRDEPIRKQMPVAWPSRNCTIPELFASQAASTPDAIALRLDNDKSLTYRQLDEQSNRLAHHLIALGVVGGDLIGLCMERSADTIVGLLGILKAGAAYVPLDPEYPDTRLEFMLRDTAARLVIAHRQTSRQLVPFGSQTNIVCQDAHAAAIATQLAHQPQASCQPSDLAYVIYTSGSTGNPKGVLVDHRAVVRLVRDTNYCTFGRDEVFIHLAPLAFDASTFEIWGPLLNGGSLAVLPPFPLTPDALATTLARHGVTTLWLTAGLFNLVAEQRVDAFKNLRQLVAGGDILSPTHVGRALEVMEHGLFFNGYGPTENTTFSATYCMKHGHQMGATVPIGVAIANSTVHVLDEQLREVPTGTPGELYVGGDGVAKGYLNNPELTREKFVPDPFSTDPAARLYRTGDRVFARPDGVLEFVGRFDNQLKIMGHRIEPGEIEAVLGQHPSVGQIAVVARKLPRGDKQLAAYVVPAQPGNFSATELKTFLGDRLPPHMIPARIVAVDQFPLNHNGKVDRSLLAAMDQPAAQPAATNASATDMEQKIAGLWSRILGCRVGLDDNFFDAGGNSLLLLEVNAELSKLVDRPLEWTELFEHTTVRSLASSLSGANGQSATLTKAQDRARRQKEAFGRQKLAKGARP